MRIRFCISLSLSILLAAYGCGASSESEMRAAQRAMQEAKSLHADNFAPTDFQQGQNACIRAEAAVKEGKMDTAKVLFTSAKIFFNKSAGIAKAKRDALFRELGGIQRLITSNFKEVQNGIAKNTLPPKLQIQVQAIVSEVEQDKASITKLVNQEELVEALAIAKDVQKKIYNAQLILARKSVN